MNGRYNIETGCVFVGEYLDEAEVPAEFASLPNQASSKCQIQHTQVVADYLETWSEDDAEKELKVLLCDQRVVTVRGHSLKLVPNTANPQDLGSYGIVVHSGKQEVFVALFRVAEVKGVFSGEMSSPTPGV